MEGERMAAEFLRQDDGKPEMLKIVEDTQP